MNTAGFDLRRASDTLQAGLPQYLADLRSLVGIDSGTFDKEGVNRVVDILERWYRELGATVERQPGDVYGDVLTASFQGTGPGSVLLIGHTDTVYPLGTVEARRMRADGDQVIGPGTADMKAGDLSIVYALRGLLDQGADLPKIVVLHNPDEEIGSPSNKEVVASLSSDADAVLVLEPGRENGDVVVARKGIMDIQIWAEGRSAHAGVNHDQGRSAVLALAHLVTAAEGLNGSLPDLTVNVGRIEGGDRPNVVPDRAYARLEIRAFDRDVLEGALDRIRRLVESPSVEGTRMRMQVSVEHWPMHRSEGGERLYQLARGIAGRLGLDLGATATGGASDGNTAAAAGRPVLDGLGPVGGRAHSPDEYVVVSSVVPRTALLAGLIAALAHPDLRDPHPA